MSFQEKRIIPIEIVNPNSPAELLLALNQWLELELIADKRLELAINARENSVQETLALTITTSVPIANFLEGLGQWQERGWLTASQIRVVIRVRASHPPLLQGLEQWLQLGLLGESQVKQLCRENLSCVMPILTTAPTREPLPDPISSQPPPPPALPSRRPEAPRRIPPQPPTSPRRQETPSQFGQMLQSLMAELSVLWLLLLGVFMVVISSGVLAANFWEKFSTAGQYGVLWLYTLAFWGASFWSSQQPRLRLTSQALRLVTLLLVPMNFLAMDSLGLWRNPLAWLIVVVAALSLTAVTVQLFRGRYGGTGPAGFSQSLPNHLGLSYLHWGWAIGGFPLLATYLGVVGTTLISLSRVPEGAGQEAASRRERLAPFSLNEAIVVYGLVILLVRAIFIAQVEISQLGLAVGICGWLASWQTRQSVSLWQRIGGSLLLLGWLLSVGETPWQALAVSGLSLLFFARRIGYSWRKFDLAAALLIGLQGLWLAWRLLPDTFRQGAITLGTGLTGAEATPWALLSLVFFPYLVLILFLTDWFSQLGKRELASFTGSIALFWGTTLTFCSLVNPALRTLNLAASTLALVIFSQRQVKLASLQEISRRFLSLAYLTHLAGLLTLILAIDWGWPRLSWAVWGVILIMLAVLELAFSVKQPFPPTSLLHLLHHTTWKLGLILAGLSYGLFILNQVAVFAQLTSVLERPLMGLEWGLVWGLAPLALTGVGTWNLARREVASWLSIDALALWQWLILTARPPQGLEPGIASISLGIATGLMFVNSRNLEQVAAAAITVGFGLSWLALCLWDGSFGWALRQEASWLLAGVITATSLWILRQCLRALPNNLARIYAQVSDGWATCLSLLMLLALSGNVLNSPDGREAIATWLLMGATAYRSWQPSRQPNLVIWLSISVLLVAQIPTWVGEETRLVTLAIATGLMFFQTHRLQKLAAAAITVGLSLGLSVALLERLPLPGLDWLLAGAIALIPLSLWLLRYWLSQRTSALALLYARACDGWAIALCSLELVALTLHSLAVYSDWMAASSLPVLAAALTLGAIAYRSYLEPSNWGIYGVGWSLELFTIEVLNLTKQSLIALAIANILLGLLTQLLGDWWHRDHRREMLNSWNILPLLYGALGAALRWGFFSSWTGLSSLGLVLIAIGVGRRSPAGKPLLYLGIGGISISAYELLFYQIADLSQGDQFLAMAALAANLVYGYRLLSPWLAGYLHLTASELKLVAHLHWALGSCLLLGALFYPVAVNQLLGLATGIFLTRYAIWQGRNHPDQAIAEIWVYLGILEATGIGVYAANTIPPMEFFSQYLVSWLGVITSGVAVFTYLLPWRLWGWPPRPWQFLALVLPGLALGGSLDKLNPLSLLVVAGFYAWLAWLRQQPRWRYLTLLLVNWAIALWLADFSLATPFAYSSLVGLSILCLVWIEPTCQGRQGKSLRHLLRLLGTGIIASAALWFHHQTGILPGILSLVAIFAGLALRIRAFLYLGTFTFVANAFYQLVILISLYPLLKWIIGLLVGVSLLSIAGNFETRRTQLTSLLQNWLRDLQEWD
ncbi:MAG: hypothetical protein LW635_00795 [Microcystis sp. 53598_E5]|jgi:hypothetical protein|uniref:hypothetical protein n=1 Tax=Microcystis sp. M53598_WE2 TaxID=3030677 RepID=UPI00258E7593|nr:hypothetical protein [Microcystis sp. M53598_WE2]MCE2672141.1 hypothetical protein [Microcystis sp. 53598_E5]MDJ0673519.1 hypothetical protein [Microcystis sp. M53598_WE2]